MSSPPGHVPVKRKIAEFSMHSSFLMIVCVNGVEFMVVNQLKRVNVG